MARLALMPQAAVSSTTTEQMPMIDSNAEGTPHRQKVVKRRVRRCALCVAPLAIVAAGWTFASTQQDPFHECDRQCRAAYGFYDRSVTGARTGALGQHCTCSRAGEPLGAPQPYQSHKAWNGSFWCGDFNTSLVCAAPPSVGQTVVETHGAPQTTTRGEAALLGLTVLHCGACAACSTPHDLEVLNASKSFATVRVTRCATAYAKPGWLGGHRDVSQLAACLAEADVGFSTDGGAWAQPAGRPTCMDCWTDNIACDAVACVTTPDCIRRFFDPAGTAFAGCIRCDELHCGTAFIRCAGANRRSSGIVSDIARPGQQVCPIGFWSPPSSPPP